MRCLHNQAWRTTLALALSLFALTGSARGAASAATSSATVNGKYSSAETPSVSARGTDESPLVVRGNIAAEVRDAPKSPNEMKESERAASVNWWTMIGTVATALITGVMMLIAGAQAWLFVRQLRLMDATAKDTAAAARAAEASAAAVRNTERAFVFAQSVAHNMNEWRNGAGPLEWTFKLTNYGRTPAWILRIEAFATVSDGKPTPEGWDNTGAVYQSQHARFVETEKLSQGFVLEPGASSEPFSRSVERILTLNRDDLPTQLREERENLRLMTSMPGATYVWLIGSVIYRDMYNIDCKTTFCWGIDQPFGTVSERGGPTMNLHT